ncbi:MAG TPA: energy-coupling factor transporter transmembrane protein EcfT [Firmicutes bacterium]|nr:energy-coupling factor transporter transmembrane protein EcfT [Bacillota bacterium]
MKFLGGFTIGQYIPLDSAVHNLDPRTKFIGLTGVMAYIFLFPSLVVYLFLMVSLHLVLMFSSLRYRYIWRGLRPVLFLILFSAFFNLFFTPGETLWWKITKEGLYFGLLYAMRIYLLVFSSIILTFTTSPIRLTDAMEYFMKPLKILKVPVEDIALMLVIALRFIPTLLEEIDRLIKAQMSRGVDFDRGNLFKRIKRLLPVFVPLFVSCFKRAEELADAMESRCYRGGELRTKREKLSYRAADRLAMVFLIIAGILCAYLFYALSPALFI